MQQTNNETMTPTPEQMQAAMQQQTQQPMQPQQLAPAQSAPLSDEEKTYILGQLGIDPNETAKLRESQEQMATMLTEKEVASQALSDNPDIKKDFLESELAKLEAADPNMAKMVRGSKAGMDMFMNGLKNRLPQEPDKITDDAAPNGDGEDDLDKRIKDGKVGKNLTELGSWLGKQKK